jgi:hypothetical protein
MVVLKLSPQDGRSVKYGTEAYQNGRNGQSTVPPVGIIILARSMLNSYLRPVCKWIFQAVKIVERGIDALGWGSAM